VQPRSGALASEPGGKNAGSAGCDWQRVARGSSYVRESRLRARPSAPRPRLMSRSSRRAPGTAGSGASGALVRTRRQERGERGGACRRVARGFVLRARGAAASADPRGAATFDVGGLVGESGEGRPRGSSGPPPRTLRTRRRLAGAYRGGSVPRARRVSSTGSMTQEGCELSARGPRRGDRLLNALDIGGGEMTPCW
jgi:hypothetical protein